MTAPHDRFEQFIREGARGYNQPPAATPRDAMWTAIEAGRRRRAQAQARQRIQLRWVVGIAAVLVLGVAIGRFTAPGLDRRVAVAPVVANQARDNVFQVAAGEYLGRVETLLTMFRVQARTGGPDHGMSTTARGLLSTSRLLIDSPAGNDPRMKELLQDLELVLAQIAQRSAEKGVDPTSFILQALDDKGVLFRLRAAMPAATPVNPQGALQ